MTNSSEREKKERKRLQNRMAQRTYRQNQKQKIQALEAAIINATSHGQTSPSTLALHKESSADAGATDTEDFAAGSGDQTIDTFEEHANGDWDILDSDAFQLGDIPSTTQYTGQPVLHRAIRNGNESMTRLLLEHGADINQLDLGGNTALHSAAEYGGEVIVKLLLDEGAEPNLANYLNQTPLCIAVQRDDMKTAKALLQYVSTPSSPKADVNWKDATGMSALHLAVECGFESMTRLLLDSGADINA